MPKTRNLAALAIGAAAFCFAAGPASAPADWHLSQYRCFTTPYDIILVTDNGGGGLTAAFLGRWLWCTHMIRAVMMSGTGSKMHVEPKSPQHHLVGKPAFRFRK